jgi:two-component system sensor histidine kinase/response regulator
MATILVADDAPIDRELLVTLLGYYKHRLLEASDGAEAEDNPVNQTLGFRMLEKQGHTVVVVAKGQEALTALTRESFDLVLMDVQMPIMDGFETTATIRAQEERSGAHLPIVAMTAHAMQGDREQCLHAGMDDYLPKPMKASDLSVIIERVLENTRIANGASPEQDSPSGPYSPALVAGL